jgi:hypothetical protein
LGPEIIVTGPGLLCLIGIFLKAVFCSLRRRKSSC